MPAAGVTIVVPTRGTGPFLHAALASLGADSEHVDEVIVVENGASALTDVDVAPARLLRLAPAGRSRARNAGVTAARTPFVAFLDDDDLSLPGRIGRQLEALAARPEASLCFGPIQAIDAEGRVDQPRQQRERERYLSLLRRDATYEGLLVDCPIYTSATIVRREPFLACGGYDERIEAYEDLDLYLRLARRSSLVALTGEPVAAHRAHLANTPSSALYEGSLLLVEKHLADAGGSSRRLLLGRRVDALWGLGRFRSARGAALRAALRDPRLLGDRQFVKRLAGSLLPARLLERRRADGP